MAVPANPVAARSVAVFAAMLMALVAAVPAAAAMPGLYFTGFYMDSTLAYSNADAKIAGMDRVAIRAYEQEGLELQPIQSEITDSNDIGFSFSVGYQLTDYFAAELTYVDMGTVHYQSVGPVTDGVGFDGTGNPIMSAKTKGPLIAGVAIWPLGDRWALDARAGMLFGKTRVSTAVIVDQFYYFNTIINDNQNSLQLGAGVNWSMSPGTAIRAGYSRLGKAMVSRYDVSSWTLSLKYAW